MTFTKFITAELKSREGIKKILFIDGSDIRAQEAALEHAKHGIIEPILLLEKPIEGLDKRINTIIISEQKHREEDLINKYVERRKGKETVEDAKKVIYAPQFFAMLLLEMNEVDGVIGGLINPTSDILRAAFKVIGPVPGVKTISSVMIMEKGSQWSLFTDISVIPEPTKDQLVDIAYNASQFGKQIGFEEKVSFLSFSTSGSAKHPRAIMVQDAAAEYNAKYKPAEPALGEIQFDAAFDMGVRSSKYKGAHYEGETKIFVFPSLEAGNIGYKIAQRMGNYGAIGPVITGVAKPVNDLSRGAKADDVYNTALITAIQA